MDEQLRRASIAHRFYVRGQSKIEIAADLGLSRFKVARLLSTAARDGLVRIEFDLPIPIELGLSEELREAYGLRRALVLNRAHSTGERAKLRDRIGAVAAQLLSDITGETDVLGLTWARSVNAMAAAIPRLPPCPIVQLCGVHAGMDMRERSVETVRHVAQISGATAYPIYGPLVLPDRHTTETLRQQPGITETFNQFEKLTKAVVSIGAWRAGESTVYDTLDAENRATLSRAGAIAEIAGRLFDDAGNALSTGLAHHILGIDVADLRKVPEVIALGYGAPKATAIDAVLRSGISTTLITDADAAEELLGAEQ